MTTHVRIVIDLEIEADGVSGQAARYGTTAADAVAREEFVLDANLTVEQGDDESALTIVYTDHLKLR